MKANNNIESNNTPRVYVGTCHKYASGDLFGAWLDLADYADYGNGLLCDALPVWVRRR